MDRARFDAWVQSQDTFLRDSDDAARAAYLMAWQAWQAAWNAAQASRAVGKGVQPPDGTTEASSRAMFVARLEAVPKDDLLSPNWVLALLNDCDMLAQREARANVAEPSMSTTSPSAYSVTDAPVGYCIKGDDDCVCITNMHLCINFRHIEGGAKP